MTAHPKQDTTLDRLFELINQDGLDALAQAFVLLLNQAMKLERQHYLRLEPYERNPERRHDWANGFKDKTLKTRLGELTTRDSAGTPGAVLSECPGKRAALGKGLEAGLG